MRPIVACVLALSALVTSARASAAPSTEAELRARRCWERTSLALVGTLRSPVPVDSGGFPAQFMPARIGPLLGEYFYPRFAGFVSSRWQREQAGTQAGNAPYYVALEVLSHERPWSEVFLGPYGVDFTETARLVADPDGLGYFRVKEWQLQHAGNEAAGYKLATAYRILNNVVGYTAVPSASNNLGDASATGRAAPGCRGCHFDGPFALDKVARVLNRRVGFGADITFAPPSDGPQTVLDGRTVTDDRGLVEALVRSEMFTFNTCRLVFQFMYGRPESGCEAPLFDACVSAFEATGTIQGAIMGLVQHPDYCR